MEEAQVKCGHGDTFTYMGHSVDLREMGCSKNPKEAEIVEEDSYCGPQSRGVKLNIGFKFGHRFSPILKVCHSVDTEETHWVQHSINGPSLGARTGARGANNLKEGGVFYKRISASKAYGASSQNRHFQGNFGKERADRLLSSAFDRGHLAPDADFMAEDWQEATYYYANTAPQWPQINRGNWLAVEKAVRKMAEREKVELDVVTGTYGVLRLEGQEVWLSNEDKSKRKLIPVPRVLWKMVREPLTSRAIVFVTLNNPHYKKVTRVQVFCPDVCQVSGWENALDLRKNSGAGYTFCCSLKEFIKSVPWLPVLSVKQEEELLNFN